MSPDLSSVNRDIGGVRRAGPSSVGVKPTVIDLRNVVELPAPLSLPTNFQNLSVKDSEQPSSHARVALEISHPFDKSCKGRLNDILGLLQLQARGTGRSERLGKIELDDLPHRIPIPLAQTRDKIGIVNLVFFHPVFD